jgi:hypothetical protein
MRKYYLEVFNIYFLQNLSFTLFVFGNVARKSCCFFGGKIQISKGGGGINIRFRPKYRPLIYYLEDEVAELFLLPYYSRYVYLNQTQAVNHHLQVSHLLSRLFTFTAGI